MKRGSRPDLVTDVTGITDIVSPSGGGGGVLTGYVPTLDGSSGITGFVFGSSATRLQVNATSGITGLVSGGSFADINIDSGWIGVAP